jgi:cyclase
VIEIVKTRIIPCVLYKNGIVVKSKRFANHRNIGSCVNVVRVYDAREVDELVFLDVDATNQKREIPIHIVKRVLDECFMPLTIGGGVRNINGFRKLFNIGADKVAINTEAFKRPELITEAARLFGSQSVVVSIDAKKNDKNEYEVYINSGTVPTGISPTEWAKKAEKFGAGEILLTSIDNDGMMSGFDIELINQISSVVNIPVIAAGGAGCSQDFVDAIKKGGASAVSAASIFHFTQETPLGVKKFMKEAEIDVRI